LLARRRDIVILNGAFQNAGSCEGLRTDLFEAIVEFGGHRITAGDSPATLSNARQLHDVCAHRPEWPQGGWLGAEVLRGAQPNLPKKQGRRRIPLVLLPGERRVS
jgi:hypothetical protein